MLENLPRPLRYLAAAGLIGSSGAYIVNDYNKEDCDHTEVEIVRVGRGMGDRVVYNNGNPASERDAECTMDRLNQRDCEAVREEARRRIQQLDSNWDLSSVQGTQGDCRSVIDDYEWKIKESLKE